MKKNLLIFLFSLLAAPVPISLYGMEEKEDKDINELCELLQRLQIDKQVDNVKKQEKKRDASQEKENKKEQKSVPQAEEETYTEQYILKLDLAALLNQLAGEAAQVTIDALIPFLKERLPRLNLSYEEARLCMAALGLCPNAAALGKIITLFLERVTQVFPDSEQKLLEELFFTAALLGNPAAVRFLLKEKSSFFSAHFKKKTLEYLNSFLARGSQEKIVILEKDLSRVQQILAKEVERQKNSDTSEDPQESSILKKLLEEIAKDEYVDRAHSQLRTLLERKIWEFGDLM